MLLYSLLEIQLTAISLSSNKSALSGFYNAVFVYFFMCQSEICCEMELITHIVLSFLMPRQN